VEVVLPASIGGDTPARAPDATPVNTGAMAGEGDSATVAREEV
jgi:hypothetical protein